MAPCREVLSFIYQCGIHASGAFYCSLVLFLFGKKLHSISVTKCLSAFLMATLELYSQSTGTLLKLTNLSCFLFYIKLDVLNKKEIP